MDKENIYRILKPIVKLFVKFGNKCPDVIKIMEKAFVEEANRVIDKPNNSTISAITGIDRRKVPLYLKGEKIYTPPDKLNLVCAELKHCTENGRINIPIKGVNSFESILNKAANGRLTINSALNELERTGRIRIIGEEVMFISTIIDGGVSDQKLAQVVGDGINFVCETALYNQNVNNNKLIQWWTYSKQIPPEKSDEVNNALFEQSARHREEHFKLLEKFETTRFEKYPAIGIMQNQYNFNYFKQEQT